MTVPGSCHALAAILILAGGSRFGIEGTGAGAVRGTDTSEADEGPRGTESGEVERVLREPEKERVQVALRLRAQMYFLHERTAGFEAHLRLLEKALETKRPVRCTLLRYSGRIVDVEWATPETGRTGTSGPQRFSVVATMRMMKEDPPPDLLRVPITHDPRFFVRARIEKTLSGTSPWEIGSTLIFVIHSPAQMFGRYDVRDERFRLTFEVAPVQPKDHGCKYCVRSIQAVPRSE